jgi:hypothetical protein
MIDPSLLLLCFIVMENPYHHENLSHEAKTKSNHEKKTEIVDLLQ